MSKRMVNALAIALASSALLAGCVVTPVGPRAYVGVGVAVAPPAPQAEVIGVAPYPGYVWFPGYWNWVGGRHVWVRGYWGPGRPGYHWVAHTWVRYGGGWRLRPGYWAR